MYLAETYCAAVRSVADLFDNINGRSRAYLAAIATSRGVIDRIDIIETYTFDTRKRAAAGLAVSTTAGEFTHPVAVGRCQLCFSLAQLSSLLVWRADLADQFRQLVMTFKTHARHPTGILYTGDALVLTY